MIFREGDLVQDAWGRVGLVLRHGLTPTGLWVLCGNNEVFTTDEDVQWAWQPYLARERTQEERMLELEECIRDLLFTEMPHTFTYVGNTGTESGLSLVSTAPTWG